MRWMQFIVVLMVLAGVALGQNVDLVTQPATQPAFASKPVEKDGLQVTVTLPNAIFASNEPIKFTVQFKNVSEKPLILQDAEYFWDWRITFEGQRKEGAWRLVGLFDADRKAQIKTLKPGEEIVVPVKLEQGNDMPRLPFQYVWEGNQKKSLRPIKILHPGRYQLVIEMTRKDGPQAYQFWNGTIKSEPVEFEITDKIAATQPATQPAVGLSTLVGQSITLTGTYGGPAKFADSYIRLNATEWVYFKGKLAGLRPTYGQQIQATGTLRYDPGVSTPPVAEGLPPHTGIPAHYLFESAVIAAATQPAASRLQAIELVAGMKRLEAERLIAEATGVQSNYFLHAMDLSSEVTYRDGSVALVVRYEPGTPSKWYALPSGAMETTPPVDGHVLSWEFFAEEKRAATQPAASTLRQIKLAVGMKRFEAERLIAEATGVKSKYNLHAMDTSREVTYRDGGVALVIQYKPGFPSPTFSMPGGGHKTLPPIDGEVRAWHFVTEERPVDRQPGQPATQPASPPNRAKTSMKGWELYVWQENGEVFYSLLVGTNRDKTSEEIAKAAVKGLDAIKNQLEELKEGQEISLMGQTRTAGPPEAAADALIEYCKKIGLQAQK